MADTTVMDLPTTWTELAAGQQDGLIQLRTIGLCEVFIGTAAPADDAAQHGVIMDSEFSWSGLTASDNVYGRSRSGETERVAVMTLPVPA